MWTYGPKHNLIEFGCDRIKHTQYVRFASSFGRTLIHAIPSVDTVVVIVVAIVGLCVDFSKIEYSCVRVKRMYCVDQRVYINT